MEKKSEFLDDSLKEMVKVFLYNSNKNQHLDPLMRFGINLGSLTYENIMDLKQTLLQEYLQHKKNKYKK